MAYDGARLEARGFRINYNSVDYLNTRFGVLTTERSTFEPAWKAIARLCSPRSGRWFAEERNRGTYKHQDILNESGLFARRILSAGLLSGMTNPSRPWFELTFDDEDLASFHEHKVWLRKVRDRMLTVFRVSNAYNGLFATYNELGPFASACTIVDEHFDNVVHLSPLTIGQYCLFTDDHGFVAGMCEERNWTVEQIVRRFVRKNGWGCVSAQVVEAYDKGSYDQTFTVRHMIRPRPDVNPEAWDGTRFPVQSVYWQPERTGPTHGQPFLDDTGYDETPLLAPRWEVVGNDVYGHGCGEDALGAMRQAQHMERTYGVALEQMVRPTMIVPSSLKRRGRGFAPGTEIVVKDADAGAMIRPAYQHQPRLAEFDGERRSVAERTYQAFYADVITAISSIRRQGSGADPTATEIQEIVGEKLMMLGPALERMQVELIEPLIDRTFAVMNRAGLIPPPPERIQGRQIKINHISQLAQAQRAVAVRGIERSWGFTRSVLDVSPGVLDVVNRDKMIRHYWESQGTPPDMLNSDDDVQKQRAGRAQEEAMAKEQEMLASAAGAARDAAQVPTQGGDSNLVADLAGL